MPDRWRFEKVGLGYHCWADEIQTHLHLTRLRRSHGDLTGELRVVCNIRDVKTQSDGTLSVNRLNVLSSTSKASLVKMLESRTRAAGQDMDWFDGVEALCQGAILAEQDGEPVQEVGTAAARPQSDKFMVEPLVLKGQTSLIFGPGGSGKSLVALACGLSVAVGREIIPGIAPAVHGNVLYLDWETEWAEINDRIQAIAIGHGLKPSGMFYRQCRRPLADDVEKLAETVAEKKIVLVIVDSAGFAMGAQGEWGDANESTIRLHLALRQLGTTNHIIDHVNRIDARTPPGKASPYGSIYKDNAARMNWELRKAPANGTSKIGLYHHKTNNTGDFDPIGLSLTWANGAVTFGRWVFDESESGGLGDAESTAAAIKEILVDGPAGLPQIASYFPKEKYNTVKGTARRMVLRGEVTHGDDGLYRLLTEPPKLRSL